VIGARIVLTKDDDGQEVLKIHDRACLIAIIANHFIIDDKRKPMPKPSKSK
jgi:hypothetical protein